MTQHKIQLAMRSHIYLHNDAGRIEKSHDQQDGQKSTHVLQKEIHPVRRVGELLQVVDSTHMDIMWQHFRPKLTLTETGMGSTKSGAFHWMIDSLTNC